MVLITVENRESLSNFVEGYIYISAENQDKSCHQGNMCLVKEVYNFCQSLTIRNNDILFKYNGFLSGIDPEYIIFNFTLHKKQEKLAICLQRLFKSRFNKRIFM